MFHLPASIILSASSLVSARRSLGNCSRVEAELAEASLSLLLGRPRVSWPGHTPAPPRSTAQGALPAGHAG